MSESGGKMKKSRSKVRHDPLDKEIRAQTHLQGDERKAKLRKHKEKKDGEAKVPENISRKIAQQALEQQEEMAAEERTHGMLDEDDEEAEELEDYDEDEEEVEEIEFDELDGK